MLRPLVSIVLLTLSVSACGREPPPAPAPQSTPAAQQPPQATSASPTALAQTPESQQATAAQESAGDTSPEERSDASLERLAALPASQQLPSDRWKVGTNYKPLVPTQPTNVSAGKVEVVEVFWYGCPHCKALEPYIASWMQNKPEYVQLTRIPVMWGPGHRAHAKLFYTLEALGRHDLHQKVFDYITPETPLISNNDADTFKQQLAFAQANGVDPKKFTDAYNSFSVASNLQRAEQLTQRYRVEAVPVIIVNGKYSTDVGMAGGPGKLIELINDLAASEKHR